MLKLGPWSLARLRWSLLSFAVLVGVGGGAAFASHELAARATQDHRQALAQRDEIRARLSRAGVEEAEIRRQLGRYRDMQAHGLIGPEHRLDWVERIAQIKEARRLIDLRFELAPQMPAASGDGFLVSAMSLQMQLLHEEDLLGFLADLAGGVQALVRVRSCNVERIAGGTTLRAECAIDWITLREQA